MDPKDIEFWSRAMKLAGKIVDKVRNTRSFQKHEILAICLAFRILNSSSAIKILLENQLIHDAKAVMRTLSEALILLAAALNKQDFMDQYYGEGLERRKRIFNKMVKGGVWEKDSLTQQQVEAQRKVSEDLKLFQSIDLRSLADDLDLRFEYYHVHNACSGEVHHLPHTMQKYLEVDEKNKKVTFIPHPEIEDSRLMICEAYSFSLKMADYLNDHFKLGMEPSIKALSQEGRAWFDKDKQPTDTAG